MKHQERRWVDTEDAAKLPVVVPLGSLEQHGHHMPMFTDTMIISEVARRAEAVLGTEAVFLPTLWLGASDHHLGFPGTVSAGNDTYVAMLEDVLESLLSAGFRRIFLLNGHGGNITPGRQAIYNVQLRHMDGIPDMVLCFSSWWSVGEAAIAQVPGLQAKAITHACEWETSMILRLRPELVQMGEAKGANHDFPSRFYAPDFSRASQVDVAKAFHQVSATGAFGHPELATAAKGEALFEAAASEVIAFVRELAAWPALEPC